MKKDYIKHIEGAERRFIPAHIEVREEGEERYFEGTGIVFNSITDLGYFSEEVATGAADDVLNDDVRGLFNHDPDVVLGRNKSGTMKLSLTDDELRYKILYNPNDPDHVRVMEKVKRGDVSQSSFAFTITDDEWHKRDGKDHRVIKKLGRLYDVSPVTYPAYADTSVAARTLERLTAELQNQHNVDDEAEREEHLRNYYNLIIK